MSHRWRDTIRVSMRRYPSPHTVSFSFGPGPISTAMKALIAANVALFILTELTGGRVLQSWLGLMPAAAITQLRIWQPATYMFLHAGLFHLLFNMLALWMFGTELERLWGRRFFVKFYFITGIGSGLLTVLVSLLPLGPLRQLYLGPPIVGASGAIYGLILAYAFYFPNRPIYMYL